MGQGLCKFILWIQAMLPETWSDVQNSETVFLYGSPHVVINEKKTLRFVIPKPVAVMIIYCNDLIELPLPCPIVISKFLSIKQMKIVFWYNSN